ncbi:hypothetical protein [Aurantimonas sp. 22II-16-19i]|uniref:hypothetical protein n=1 Tax=Aurantimonas sp. 22II-16-19i TaxID=1317114 RepID=UPI0009F7A37D|nr:hypothetical protein [Aurantimonas sp. 22II-16-19i]ORE90724.1 phosphoribosyltransferase [Aurantimonas sp. 22II-16-19i]
MRAEADVIVCLKTHDPYYTIGVYYDDFRQVSDREVTEIPSRFPIGSDSGHSNGRT